MSSTSRDNSSSSRITQFERESGHDVGSMASRFRQVSGKNGGAMGALDGENKVTGTRDGVVG